MRIGASAYRATLMVLMNHSSSRPGNNCAYQRVCCAQLRSSSRRRCVTLRAARGGGGNAGRDGDVKDGGATRRGALAARPPAMAWCQTRDTGLASRGQGCACPTSWWQLQLSCHERDALVVSLRSSCDSGPSGAADVAAREGRAPLDVVL